MCNWNQYHANLKVSVFYKATKQDAEMKYAVESIKKKKKKTPYHFSLFGIL